MNVQQVSLRTLASGQNVKIDIIEYKAAESRGKVYMQAALHGAEVQGIAVIYQWLCALQEQSFPYDVTFVPFANPTATDTKIGEYGYGRFDPKTGENWNRGFKNLLGPSPTHGNFDLPEFVRAFSSGGFLAACESFRNELKERLASWKSVEPSLAPYESLALLLLSLAQDAEYCFDLHCDSHSVPYLYIPSYMVTGRLKKLNCFYVVQTPCDFSPDFNQALFYPWWSFTNCWNQIHKTQEDPPVRSMTYEMGFKDKIDLCHAKQQMHGMMNYILDSPGETQQKTYVSDVQNFIRLRAPCGGLVNYMPEKLGCVIPAEEFLAQILSRQHILNRDTPQSIKITVPSIPLTQTASSIVHQGDEILKVMTNFFELN